MQTARRIYLYLMSGVGLVVLCAGLWQLLTLTFERIARQLDVSLVDTVTESAARSELSLALALVAVGGPLWAIHWWLVERGIRSPIVGETERSAPSRAFYLAIVELVSLGAAMATGVTVVNAAVRTIIGRPAPYDGGAEGPLAAALIGVTVWAFHAWVRRGDESSGPLYGAAAWWPRISWYTLMAAGAVMLCVSAVQVMEQLLDLVAGRTNSILATTEMVVEPVVDGLAGIVVGGGICLGLWLGLERRRRSSDWVGPSERTTAVRKTSLTGGLMLGAAATLMAAVTGASAALTWVFGASSTTDARLIIEDTLGPSIAALPFTILWWWCRRQLLAEGAQAWPIAGVAAARRLAGYAAAAVGLAFAAVGVAWLLGLIIDVVFGGQRTLIAGADAWREELATYLSAFVVGASLWLWHWLATMRRQRAEPQVEAADTSRRVYLYVVLGTSLISSVIGLALVAYRLFGIVLGATEPPNIVSELSTPIGVVIAGSLVVAYHGLLLLADQAHRPIAPIETSAQTLPVATPEGVPVEVPLIAVGPPGTEPSAVLATLRATLPPGFAIRPTPGGVKRAPTA